MDVQVRLARPEDAPAICEVIVSAIREHGPRAYSDEQVAGWADTGGEVPDYPIESDADHMVVADADGEVAGVGHLILDREELEDDEAELGAVYVRPAYGSRGVGTALLAYLEGYARGRDFESVGMLASLNAVTFYERAGYGRVDENVIETGGQELTVAEMRKEL